MVAASDPQPSHDPASNHCTGPRTDAGKARSSLNAVTHGLTAKTPLLPGEDSEEFRRFVWDVVLDLEPRGPVQAELASRAAVLMWRRRRVNDAERQVVLTLQEKYEAEAADRLAEQEEFAETPQDFEALAEAKAEEAERGDEWNRQELLADELALKPGALERLARYEQRISQQIDSTIRLLLKLQNRQDWQRGQRKAAAERSAGEPPARIRQETAVTPARAPSATPPPAPAQNELPSAGPGAIEESPPRPWTDPPGTN